MKINKKIVFTIIALVLIGSIALVGCSKETNSADNSENSIDYPNRPITMLIPHKAGGSTDMVARALQPYLQKYLGKGVSIVIENEGGGGGNAAHLMCYKAEPDGYTLEMTPFPSMVLGELVKGGKFKSLDYTFLYGVTGRDYNGIFVAYDSPYNDLDSLIEAAKNETITVSGSGVGTNSHMSLKLLEEAAGVEFEYVSYDGGTEAAVAVAGGHTAASVGNVVSQKQMVEEKKIKCLAIIGATRHASYPDVQTTVELGYEEAAMDVCLGVIAPPNLPEEIAKILEDALDKAVNDPEYQEQAASLGSTVVPLSSKEFMKTVQKIYEQANLMKNELKTN